MAIKKHTPHIVDLRNRYIQKAKQTYLKNFNAFLYHRLSYYFDTSPITTKKLEHKLSKYLPSSYKNTHQTLNELVDIFNASQHKLTVIIPTKNRKDKVKNAIDSVIASNYVDWKILLVDNGTDETYKHFESYHPKIISIPFNQVTGCAFLARNIALDFIDYAYRHSKTKPPHPYIMMLDSDDTIKDDSSLATLMALTTQQTGEDLPPAIVHGYCEYTYTYEDNVTKNGTYPEYFTNGLPTVSNLSEFFNKGPNILSAAILSDFLLKYRYPEEFSFEDNGLNHKLIYYLNKENLTSICINTPIVKKNWGVSSEAGKNNLIGDTEYAANLSGIIVRGLRARVVEYLSQLGTFFKDAGL